MNSQCFGPLPSYKNDGKGRDTYISFYNGGFTNYPYSKSYKKDCYEISHKRNIPDLFLRRPIIKYNMDGNGRDYFIYQNILSERCKFKQYSDFPHILRKELDMKTIGINKSNSRSKFEKTLINRIFYGKCPGIKDRLMMPKVKFSQKEIINDIKYNFPNPSLTDNNEKTVRTIIKSNSDMNQRLKKYNVHLKIIGKNFNSNIKFPISNDHRKTLLNNIEKNENDFFNSGKLLYSVNNKKNKNKEHDLPILI